MKKIILSANSSWYLYNFRASTISTLLARNFSVICISPKDNYSESLVKLGAEWRDIEIDASGTNPFTDLILTYNLYKKYLHFKPIAVFHFTIKNNVYGAIAARFAGINSFSNITGLGTAFINKSFLSMIVKILYKFSQSKCIKVFCQNQEDLNFLEKYGLVSKEKLVLLPGSGVNMTRFSPNPLQTNTNNRHLKFLFAGRMLKDKGLVELINSIKTINSNHVCCELWLVGFSSSDNTSAITISELNSWSKVPGVTFFGESNKIEDFLSQADVAILPSYREGMPKFLLEAGAMQIPSITTDVPGCRHIITHQYNGLICQPRDEESLTSAIQDMINMPKHQRLELGKNARSLIEQKFDEKIVISKTLAFLPTADEY
jgi:glycosyltransferase involved in cell wall biosynthesis|tara:strand:+ start:613 stop:1734 length:1122 start_codon:yes stop_codon:yes gene_type:complete